MLMGAAIAAAGYILMFPFTVVAHVGGMQTTQMAHSILSMILVAIILAHIYIGTIGMEGVQAMGSGKVDSTGPRRITISGPRRSRAREQRGGCRPRGSVPAGSLDRAAAGSGSGSGQRARRSAFSRSLWVSVMPCGPPS
ncbi:MAG: hypothetical protein R3D25_01965 [Geminicoccaceae bacterium]